MKKITMRGHPFALVFLCVVLAGIEIVFSIVSLYILMNLQTPVFVWVVCGVSILGFLMPLAILLLWTGVPPFFTKVMIQPPNVSFKKPFQGQVTVPIQDIAFFGCVSYTPRGFMLFFSSVSIPEMQEYLKGNWDVCIRIFGTDTVEELKKTEEGREHLAISTYLFRHSRHKDNRVVILKYGSRKRLETAVSMFKRDAVITGPLRHLLMSQLKEQAVYRLQNQR